MKICYASDLHFESNLALTTKELNSLGRGDLLILVGDIIPAKRLLDLEQLMPILDSGVGQFFKLASKRYKKIIYIVGNHEYYGLKLNDTISVLQRFVSNFDNVELVYSGRSFVIDNNLFLCGTMWTDFANEHTTLLLNGDKYINDYRIIFEPDSGKPITPAFILEQHKSFVNWVTNYDVSSYNNAILVTHHSPSYITINEKYKDAWPMNGLFCSNLDKLLTKFDYAIHGHQHDKNHSIVGDCKIFSNPKGYRYECNDFKFEFLEI